MSVNGIDWTARARREAAAIIAEAEITRQGSPAWDTLVSLVAIGWLQGVNLGAHETLTLAEASFEELRAAL